MSPDGATSDGVSNEETLTLFRSSIREEEDLLYGVALFFEGISVLYAEEEAMIETYRKQLRNLIQTRHGALQSALALLERAEAQPEEIVSVRDFQFPAWQSAAGTGDLASSARILVRAYDREFPDRPREKPFDHAETLQLMEAAALSG